VEVEDLFVQREGRAVLDVPRWGVQAGTLHVVAGPNGSGKSTLLTALLGQLPFSGRIRLRLPEGRRVALVPQRFHVDRTLPLSVLDFLTLRRTRRPACLGVSKSNRLAAL
jgi:zinc transport system ATP-binding protein